MTRYYCTVFDRAYLCKGLALYESLLRHSSSPFCLYVLALDEPCRIELARLNLEHAVTIEIGYFEKQMRLAEVRASRTWTEYCYTLASQFTSFLMNTGIREINYIDADCHFFSNPETVFEEIGERSIGIVPHRFQDKDRERLSPNGEYNVSLVHFKATYFGRECLSEWARDCREWCYARNEPGRYADQFYLNFWPGKYGNECAVIENIGVGLAPWNLAKYEITEGPYVDGVAVCMFHAHEFSENEDGTFRFTNYPLRSSDVDFIYARYLKDILYAKQKIDRPYRSLSSDYEESCMGFRSSPTIQSS